MRNDAGRVHVSWVVILVLILSTTVSGGPARKAQTKKQQAGKAAAKAPDPQPVITFDLSQMALPDTTDLPMNLPKPPVPPPDLYAWDKFAWQSFIAMNWPAIDPNLQNLYVRGWPDPQNSFVCAGIGDLGERALVWETFKEKREVFNHYATTEETAKPKPWSHPFDYSIVGVDGHPKILTEGINFVTLDETVEVASQAREVGTKVPVSTPVFPRVYRGTQPSPPHQVPGNSIRYEVKVNYDFFKYVVDNKFYFDENTYARSLQNPPAQLPWRTSAVSPGVKYYTQKPARTNYVAGYSANKLQAIYTQGPMRGETPPEIGAVHIKAAWVPIDEAEKDKFLHRRSTYFVTDPLTRKTRKTTHRKALFGLVGLHIIQRIKVAPVMALVGGNANPTPTLNSAPAGGTFIYATWEHIEIDRPNKMENQKYTYDNLYFDGETVKTDGNGPYPVERLYKIITHTQQANDAFWKQIGDVRCGQQKVKPVWLNYRLVGVQFLPFDIPTAVSDRDIEKPNQVDPGEANNSGLPHYLANLYVETNKGLQHFQGLPPLTTPANQFTVLGPIPSPPSPKVPPPNFYPGNLAKTFEHTEKNMAYGGNLYNMGGCMGCHGVAQLKGYSFSFVLLGGQLGAGIDTESKFEPPTAVRNRYLLSGGAVKIQNAYYNQYLAIDGTLAVRQADADLFTIIGVNTAPGERLSFGDQVYLFERRSRLFLTATDHPLGDYIKTVEFQADNTDSGAVWTLYSPELGKTGQITSLSNLSFQSTKSFADGNPAYLTSLTYPPDSDNHVNTTDHAAADLKKSLELWNLTRIR